MESVGRRAEVCSPSLYERIHECIETKNDGGGGGVRGCPLLRETATCCLECEFKTTKSLVFHGRRHLCFLLRFRHRLLGECVCVCDGGEEREGGRQQLHY